jgi:hypothetical protein
VNTTTEGVDYIIIKGAPNQEEVAAGPVGFGEDTLRSTYFGAGLNMQEPFAALHNDEEVD